MTPQQKAEAYIKELTEHENWFDQNLADKIYKDAYKAALSDCKDAILQVEDEQEVHASYLLKEVFDKLSKLGDE